MVIDAGMIIKKKPPLWGVGSSNIAQFIDKNIDILVLTAFMFLL